MDYKTLEQIIVNLPIYGSFSFPFADLKDSSKALWALKDDARARLCELFFVDKVNLKCVDCKKEYPFSVKHTINKIIFENTTFSKLWGGGGFIGLTLDSKDLLSGGFRCPKEDEGIISYVFTCTMNPNHYYTMDLLYTLKDSVLSIRKIGQKPLNTDLQESHSNEYEKILKKYDSFDDYKHYEQSASRNLLAGACTYLRRIFEKMVITKLNNSKASIEEKAKATKFEDKIKLVKACFDEDVQDLLKASYGLLSKGIHELKNEEIESFYKLILEVINIQLESEKEKMEREEKRKKLRSEINEVSSKQSK